MPATSMHRRTPLASRVMSTPSASSTSALPHRLDAARFPCFATGVPAPAATSAAAVEILNVPARSPPVPQVSIAPGGRSSGVACARIEATKAVISSTLSPLARAPGRAGARSPAAVVRSPRAASWAWILVGRRRGHDEERQQHSIASLEIGCSITDRSPARALDLGELDTEVRHGGVHPVDFEREGSLRLIERPPGLFGVGTIGTGLDAPAGLGRV